MRDGRVSIDKKKENNQNSLENAHLKTRKINIAHETRDVSKYESKE
jgi:hypothetical protein